MILLDGLDEVAKQDERRAIADWVERQTRQYPKNDFGITSRPRGYRATPIARFVRSWYRSVERHSTTKTNADDLLARLATSPALADLTANPLLLTMIANVHLHPKRATRKRGRPLPGDLPGHARALARGQAPAHQVER